MTKTNTTPLAGNTPLSDVKHFLHDNWEVGATCPACTQLVRLWRHSLNSAIARTLIEMRLIQINENREYIHIMKEISITTMYGIAVFWGLIEQAEYDKEVKELEDKKASGLWKLTEKGIDFVEQKITIEKYARVYNGKVYRLEGEPVSIVDCLGKKFSYSELMKS